LSQPYLSLCIALPSLSLTLPFPSSPFLSHQCSDSFCSPQPGDLMIGRASQLWASSTCGLDGPESYCIVGYLEKCFFCDSRLPYDRHGNQNSHRIDNIITTYEHDRKKQWWQSENGVHQVSIRLDLETVFQFSHMILTFKSFRPVAMLVERSKDFGQTWKVFRYFSDDCSLHFPSVPIDSAHSVDDVICDSRYSGSEPSTNGEVNIDKPLAFFIFNVNPYSPSVQDLITLTNIRVNFTHLFTLGDTLLSRRRRDPQNKYYYALYNMVVQGSCFCNGHAHRCVPIDGGHAHQGMVHGRCVCHHNTAGENCERCMDFHHDTPWRPGGEHAANICRRCQCHGLSNSCHFDAARFEATGGVSGGVCDDCGHQRAGPQCERCRPFFYKDPLRDMNDPHACIPCECSAEGSRSSECDVLSGQCVCKENVEGRRCDRCKPGFFNMRREDPDGCQGEVLLLFYTYFHTKNLYSCFWGLGNSQVSCSPCDCDVGGAVSSGCSPEDGQCHCLPNMIGRRCSDPAPGYFLPSLELFLYEADTDLKFLVVFVCIRMSSCVFIQVRHDVTLSAPMRKLRSNTPPMVQQLSSIPLDPGHSLQIIPGQTILDQPDTWTGWGLVRVAEGAGLRFTVDNIPSSMEYHLVIHYKTEVSRLLTTSVCPGFQMGLIPSTETGQDFCSQTDQHTARCFGLNRETNPQVDLSEICTELIRKMSLRVYGGPVVCRCHHIGSVRHSCSRMGGICECQPNVIGRCCDACAPLTFGFGPDGCKSCHCDLQGSVSPLCDEVTGQCDCRPDVTGQRCDHCGAGFWGFPFCRRCDCNGLSDDCDVQTGECRSCRLNAAGPRCDRCQDGYFGEPVAGLSCQLCSCPDVQDSGRFFATTCQYDPQSHSATCLCREGHTGPRCDRCVGGYFGDLSLPGAGCKPCPCNNNIDIDGAGACDSLTGECLRCLGNTTGPRCQHCKPGFYGNALERDCKECSCERRGTEVTQCPLGSPCVCDPGTGQCPCRTGVTGDLCDTCEDRFWNLKGPSGCQACGCDPLNSASSVCDKVTGQCPCRAEFGGRQCDECGENHFGNPDLQCVSCDCNLEGTLRPSCDPETGECLCRPGVTGIFCDECAPSYSSAFPACEPCHPCTALWRESVTDVQKAGERMKTFIPLSPDQGQLRDRPQRQRMLEVHSLMDRLTNLSRLSLKNLEKMEKFCSKMGSVVLFKDSLPADYVPVHLQVCGHPTLDDCSGCGGALCRFGLGRRKCGGPNCDGALPVSQNASETARQTKNQISLFSSGLENFRNKVLRAGQRAKETNEQAKDSQERINQRLNDSVPPEDIEKMAQTVLRIQLPRSPAQVQSMIDEIHRLLSSTKHLPDRKDLEQKNKAALDLLQKAQELKTPVIIEVKLMTDRPEDLRKEVELLKKKTQQNRDVADEALQTADAALNSTDTLFEVLKLKNSTGVVPGEAEERVRKIKEEAENMRKLVEDKLVQIQGKTFLSRTDRWVWSTAVICTTCTTWVCRSGPQGQGADGRKAKEAVGTF
uniref:Laminin subunit beta 4 n=1 Tax=Cynoglossus semilaevis TaxID=244447 RepID=A0A3P8X1D7_CYNSE